MPHRFGTHEASEVITLATTFLAHVESPAIWPSISNKNRGRMTHDDVAKGRALLAVAKAARTEQQAQKGASVVETHRLDQADQAAHDWLEDQLTHARGAFAEAHDRASRALLDGKFSHRAGHLDVARDVRTYIQLVAEADALGHALAATYVDAKSRAAILKDGAHLADAVEAEVAAPAAAVGAGVAATANKEDAILSLSGWLTRWTGVARRVVGASDQHTLGIVSARHHPAHRDAHPAHEPDPTPPPSATPPTP
jgi:hypothetical protein